MMQTLKGSALTTYVNDCLSCKSYDKISEILREKFNKVPKLKSFMILEIYNKILCFNWKKIYIKS